MVVLAASICTRGGKALLSRQFRELSNDRITALLANFPSLISNSSSQHTTVEDDSVRYVYQPLEEFYIVLITNKTSNILQDIDTLHLFASTVSNLLRNVDEREVFDHAFEIIDAFDEIISLGFKENLTLSQIQTFLEMDSHEEKIQEIIERNKELEATEERKRKAKEIQRKELAKRNLEQLSQSASSGGYDSFQSSQATQSYQPTYQPTPIIETNTSTINSHSLSSKPLTGRGGLQLGKKTTRPTTESHQPLLAQSQPVFHHTRPQPVQLAEATPPISQSASPVPTNLKVPNNGILITVNEKVSVVLSREGAAVSSEVKGDLQLRINNVELAHSKILLETGDRSTGIQYNTHPKVDRNLFTSQGVISLKDKTKPFPANDHALGVLRWRAVGKKDDLSLIPIVIIAWVNFDNAGTAEVTLEYELSSDFLDSHASSNESFDTVKVLVPIASPDVNLKEAENVSYDISEFGVIFNIEGLSIENPSGSFVFTIPSEDEDSLFPMELQVEFSSTEVTESDSALGKIKVIDIVSNNDDETSLPFDLHYNLQSESYQVE
ncbi:predicted protein [Scheffersomyces stipitis CBS 6054]|uniref:Coatomer subunit delta n=1 Tax=Scheffersomyces stipitis (strain ATCC 58785 / CBS 6054 / NBRC 10063 / NRRL Y-11545) TaxID=322104 RepID=A3LVB0_PICST|nr:predicted protein [Scheffersomyces stipitis CBS 6054]ABN67091.2 predicted protein [Scheffersomyces stipitis CBS 6054]KAG2734890.1 hypothetical protein G9P44_002896 [Scheffersomyces stipitis]